MKSVFEAEDFFVVRTPRLPVDELVAMGVETQQIRDHLKAWLSRNEVLEALYLASPSFLTQIKVWEKDPTSKRGKKIEQALLKYMIRMCTRPTPFGLFSGVHMGNFAEETLMGVGDVKDDSRVTRLDMDYLTAVRSHVVKASQDNDRLCFQPNPSHYFVGEECRYIEAYRSNNSWQYRLSVVEASDYFCWVIDRAKNGVSLQTLSSAFRDQYPEADVADVSDYFEQLIAESVLVPMLPLPITGQSSDQVLLQNLNAIGETQYSQLLEKSLEHLRAQDKSKAATPEQYKAIWEDLKQGPVKVEENRLFQADLYRSFTRCQLDQSLQKRLVDIVALLQDLGSSEDRPLQDFIKQFQERFEGQLVRLDLLLDEESGISFSNETGYEAPLLAGLRLMNNPVQNAILAETHQLEKLVTEAISIPENQGKTVVQLKSQELKKKVGNTSREQYMPASFGCLISLYEDEKGKTLIKLNGAYGPSAALNPGRFAHLDAGLETCLKQHLEREEEHSPDVVFAEIAHMPEGRVGNVIARPHLRKYEIVFMADSCLDEEYQIPISDLHVWVEEGYVKLWSKRLKKQVIPRLSCAHNFSRKSLGAYRFLCMTQHQYGGVPRFQLPSSQRQAVFVPRIMIDNFVLSEALWRIPRVELEKVLAADGHIGKEQLRTLQQKYKLDDMVAYSVSDNVLYLDLRNPLMLSILLNETKQSTTVELREVLFAKYDTLVKAPSGARYNNELVMLLFNSGATQFVTQREDPQAEIEAPAIQRRFSPGAEWMSLKIYGGNSTVEALLVNTLLPLLETLEDLFEKWFFVRYSDPNWHLRLRFLGEPEKLYGLLLPRINQTLKPFLENGTVHKVEAFTYEREIERYGGPEAMELVETLFMLDSSLVARSVQLIEEFGEDVRLRTAMLSTDVLLDLFGLGAEEKLSLLTRLREQFGREFGDNAVLRKQLGKKYRHVQQVISEQLSNFGDQVLQSNSSGLSWGIQRLVGDWQEQARPVVTSLNALFEVGTVTCSKEKLLSSLIHMHNNRLFKAYGRQQEFVMHDFLRRTYFSLASRNKIA